eukprot:EG_transcript_32633
MTDDATQRRRSARSREASPPPLHFQSLIEAPLPLGAGPRSPPGPRRSAAAQRPLTCGDPPRGGTDGGPSKPPTSWNVGDTCSWLNCLGLSQDYQALVRAQHLVGTIVLSMQEEDWRRIGINAFGDLRIIQLATEELRDRRNQGGSEAWGLSRMYSSD